VIGLSNYSSIIYTCLLLVSAVIKIRVLQRMMFMLLVLKVFALTSCRVIKMRRQGVYPIECRPVSKAVRKILRWWWNTTQRPYTTHAREIPVTKGWHFAFNLNNYINYTAVKMRSLGVFFMKWSGSSKIRSYVSVFFTRMQARLILT
jgi:hypothetical protein